ncbi:hypothetical protein HC928_12700, partial [bacterium]|nr:hypothetical protein [bacterium]
FLSRDPFEGFPDMPYSQHPYQYAYSNPALWTDPSGEVPTERDIVRATTGLDCPTGLGDVWSCTAIRWTYTMRQHFLESARRHHIPELMINTVDFAALIAVMMISERRLNNPIPHVSPPAWYNQPWIEDTIVSLGCVVSGHVMKDALEAGDYGQLWQYATNQDLAQLATVGVGNVKLNTAQNLWNGIACPNPSLAGEQRENCTPVDTNPMTVRNMLGWDVPIADPSGAQVACAQGGACGIYQPSLVGAYQIMGDQLLDDAMNIEYVATNLESGGRRAVALGLGRGPGGKVEARQLAAWHLNGLLGDNEVSSFWGGTLSVDQYWRNLEQTYTNEIPTARTIITSP